MTIQQIGYFIKLAEELNFTSVAREFFITQPTLSRQIVNLENELNTELFVREHNSVKLTNGGREFYEKIKPVFMEMMGIIKETQLKENHKNTIYIGVQEEQLLSDSLMLAINRLRHKYPNLTVNILRSTTEELLTGLQNGKYDLVNMLRYPELLTYSDDLVFLMLEKEATYLYVANNIVEECDKDLTCGSKELLRKYAKMHQILLPVVNTNMDDEGPRKLIFDKFNLTDENVRFIESATPISIPLQVANGLGVSIGNRTSVSQIDPQITVFKIDDTEGSYFKGIFYRSNPENKYTTELVNLVREEKDHFTNRKKEGLV